MLRFSKTIAFGLLLGLLGTIANGIDEVRVLEENVGLGLLFTLRGPVKPPDDAVIVAVDRASSDRLKVSANPERWPRTLHARLVETLSRAGARVIVFDLYFVEPRSIEEDKTFAAAIEKAGNVVLAEQLKSKEVGPFGDSGDDVSTHIVVERVKPIELILSSAFGSAPFVLPRMPVRVSQYWTFQPNTGDVPTFPVMALQLYALEAYSSFRQLLGKAHSKEGVQAPPDVRSVLEEMGADGFMQRVRQFVRSTPNVREELKRGSAAESESNPLLTALIHLYTSESRPYLNFYGPSQTIPTIPYYRVLELGTEETEGPSIDLRGKTIFVGVSERVLADSRDSFHTVFSKAGVFLSGVEIAATAFLNLLTNKPVRAAEASQQILILFLWGIIIALICRTAPPFVAGLGVIFCAGCYLFGATSEFRANATWYPIVVPLFLQTSLGYLGAILWDYREIDQERNKVRETLGYYLPEEVVTQVARDRIDVRKYGETVYGACLFADVAGYTPVSEAMTPHELSELMHKYLEATSDPIHKHGGLVVELRGDSILALWKGDPEDPAVRKTACAGALDMAEAVRRFNQSNQIINLPTRISIHAGPIFLGNIGAGTHYEYGATGDTITTASRLDGLNKYLGTNILVTAEVVRGLDGFLVRQVGTFMMKGKTHPVEAYELICREAECTALQRQTCATFAEGRRAFEAGLWDQAIDKFAEANKAFDGDPLSRFYLELCAKHRTRPPASDWTGMIVMEEK